MTAGDETFLGRWARRKQEVREQEKPPGSGADAEPVEEDAIVAAPAATADQEPPDDPLADLPDVDTLNAESDYTGFMRDGVPDELRNRALQKLWLSDPVFANLDGLNDYDHDFATLLEEGAAALKRLAEAVDSLNPDRRPEAANPSSTAPDDPDAGETPSPPEPDRLVAENAEGETPDGETSGASPETAHRVNPQQG